MHGRPYLQHLLFPQDRQIPLQRRLEWFQPPGVRRRDTVPPRTQSDNRRMRSDKVERAIRIGPADDTAASHAPLPQARARNMEAEVPPSAAPAPWHTASSAHVPAGGAGRGVFTALAARPKN
ncbi:hypothetical protein MHUMG1_08187 [Metarhizium humberi]|uniref:Uncharacterized protein n=1 Tax=Metarhizium humberi TaxID=2596975 RepID=A0A9P8M4C6_9HYPO|nr:hypothetical protein MHUMG1_08187 [Metarhizium humberi]